MNETALRWQLLQRQPLGVVRRRWGKQYKSGDRYEIWMRGRGRIRDGDDGDYPKVICSFRGVPFKTAEQAAEALQVIHAGWVQGMSVSDACALVVPHLVQGRSVGGLLSLWFEECRSKSDAGDLSPSYIKAIQSCLREDGDVWRFWHERTIREINTLTIDEFAAAMRRRGVSAKSRKNYMGVFRTFLTWCHRRRHIATIPAIPAIPVDEYMPTLIDRNTQAAILDAIPEHRRGIFLCMALMGVRPNEARALQVQDYENPTGHDGWLVVRRACKGPNLKDPIRGTKTRKIRRLPMPEELQIWIALYVHATEPTHLLFPNPAVQPNTIHTHRSLYDVWRTACKKVGVKVSLYEGCKHAFATDAVNNGDGGGGVPLPVLQKYLGHSDIRSTERYAKYADQSLRAVLR